MFTFETTTHAFKRDSGITTINRLSSVDYHYADVRLIWSRMRAILNITTDGTKNYPHCMVSSIIKHIRLMFAFSWRLIPCLAKQKNRILNDPTMLRKLRLIKDAPLRT